MAFSTLIKDLDICNWNVFEDQKGLMNSHHGCLQDFSHTLLSNPLIEDVFRSNVVLHFF